MRSRVPSQAAATSPPVVIHNTAAVIGSGDNRPQGGCWLYILRTNSLFCLGFDFPTWDGLYVQKFPFNNNT